MREQTGFSESGIESCLGDKRTQKSSFIQWLRSSLYDAEIHSNKKDKFFEKEQRRSRSAFVRKASAC